MTDWEGRIRHMYGAIARDRSRLFGEVSNEEYAEAWAHRLIDVIPESQAQDEYHRRVQSARRAAVALIGEASGVERPAADPQDRENFDDLVAAFPDIATGENLGPDRALDLLRWRVDRLRGVPPTPEEASASRSQTTKAGCLGGLLPLLGMLLVVLLARAARRRMR
jgi:hypothetical protein